MTREKTMKSFVISVTTLIALTATAQADIICMPTGCWETGANIWLNGGAHHGLEYKRQDKSGTWRTMKPNRGEAMGGSYAPRASESKRTAR
jgi:hypothetical protein